MFGQISLDTILFFMLYGMGTATAVGACLYLLLRRGNAFAPEVTPPLRLRRWTAAFFGVIAAGHLWYLPAAVLTSDDDIMLSLLIGALLDCVLTIPLVLVVMLCMLQDRRRPLWPVGVMVAPLVVGIAVYIGSRSEGMLPWLYGYFLLMAVGFTIYMVREVRHYGHWLRDNYADLEHKEVWQSFVVLAIIMLVFAIYVFTSEGPVYQYAMQVIVLVLVFYLLWRVETLSGLSIPIPSDTAITVDDVADLNVPDKRGCGISPGAKLSLSQNIGPLLKQHCEDTQLYLQHDISVSQLANLIGTNRLYLSQHFSSLGMTYNSYINGLRIQYFINLYHEAVANHQPIMVQQLAFKSGFRSYNTFNVAFKKIMGMNTTEWIRNQIST